MVMRSNADSRSCTRCSVERSIIFQHQGPSKSIFPTSQTSLRSRSLSGVIRGFRSAFGVRLSANVGFRCRGGTGQSASGRLL